MAPSSGREHPACVVERVVPGRLAYVRDLEAGGVVSVTPDRFVVRDRDGCRRYRGEPFRQVGIRVGAPLERTVAEDGAAPYVSDVRISTRLRRWLARLGVTQAF